MTGAKLACGIYTRKSSEEGLEQSFNSLDAQREACAAFILSQKTQGWHALPTAYDDGGYSGGTLERPGLQRLLADVGAGRVQVIVVYKVDRLTRSLADFAKLVERFDAHGVSFVSVTQQFNTTSSMGRLTLNVLLSFAQFEREVTGERIRDKIAASKRKGMWMGGIPPIGYIADKQSLVIDEMQASRVREIFALYRAFGCVRRLKSEIDRRGWTTALRRTRRADAVGGRPFSRGHLYRILSNPIYVGQIAHKGACHAGHHSAIVDAEVWQAVQAQLAANRHARAARTSASHPSVLAGRVFDTDDYPMTPTHAKKGARRYRYYVSQSLLQGDRAAAREGLRIPAHELERAVIQGLLSFLSDQSRVLEVFPNDDARTASQRLKWAQTLAAQLGGPVQETVCDGDVARTASVETEIDPSTSAIRIECLRRLVKRITVGLNCLQLEIRLSGIAVIGAIARDDRCEVDPDDPPRTVNVRLPVELRRCGLGMRLIIPTATTPGRGAPDPRLVTLLAKANDWFARLTNGDADSIQSIAQQEKVSSSYIVRVVQLAFLAPDLGFAIAQGDHPPILTARRLIGSVPLPLDWDDQRVQLGFTRPAALCQSASAGREVARLE